MKHENKIMVGDVLEQLALLPDQCVQTVVTSPPYWGLRDYGVYGQLGLEKTPEEYVKKMVTVFREVRRVLRDDGTLWLNLGDSYVAGGRGGGGSYANERPGWSGQAMEFGKKRGIPGLKPKDLIGIPWRVAFALQADGWYLRSDIIWSKPNAMPEAVTDRPTKAHEYIFLMTKSAKYYYDAQAIRETGSPKTQTVTTTPTKGDGTASRGEKINKWMADNGGRYNPPDRNRRTVWEIATQSYPEAHFATFPEKLVAPCILAGTSEKGVCSKCGAPWKRRVAKHRSNQSNAARAGTIIQGKGHPTNQVRENHDIRNGPVVSVRTLGWSPSCRCNAPTIPALVLDPFIGSGTVALVALKARRRFTGIELKPKYVELAQKRIAQELAQKKLF